MFWLLGCVGWGLLATGGVNTTSLFADESDLRLFSITLFSNPHSHNIVVHPYGPHAVFFSSSKQSSGLCQNSCLQLVHVAGLRPAACWIRPVPRSSCGIFFRMFSCFCSFLFSPVSLLMVSAISSLLVARMMRFFTNSYNNDFSFVFAATRFLKYQPRDTSPIG